MARLPRQRFNLRRIMALDIGIGDGSSLIPIQGEPLVQLDNDAPYWFLHPLFERLREETGEYIDLYGDASFFGEQLAALKQVLAEARRLAAAQPDTWQVHVGTKMAPVHQELYAPLDRASLIALIEAWERVVMRAEQLGRPVVCFGD